MLILWDLEFWTEENTINPLPYDDKSVILEVRGVEIFRIV